MQNNNEFNDVRKGLPNIKKPRFFIHFILIILHFGIGLILLIAFILAGILVGNIDTSFLFAGLSSSTREIIYFFDIIFETSAYTALLALIVGMIQGFILKGKIKSRKQFFSLLSIAGGMCGGVVGGLVYYLEFLFLADFGVSNMTANSAGFIWSIAGLIMGVVSGITVGGVNSLLQNFVMNNSKHSSKWFFYNLISWSMVLGIGWALNLGVNRIYSLPFIGDAVASMFILVAHGIGIIAFLALSPQIEFY
jgi:hypothetical protein